MLESLSTLATPVRQSPDSPLQFPLQLRRAWQRETARVGLQYVDAAGRAVPGQWHADARETEALFKKLSRVSNHAVLAGIGDFLVVLQPDGVDNKLPALAGLLAQDGAELLTHRPGRRAVVRIANSDGVRYAKALRPSRTGRILKANLFVSEMRSRAFDIADIVQADEDSGLVVMRGLDGACLHDLASTDAKAFIAGCGDAGFALRSLHVSAPHWLPVHDAAAEIAMLQERLAGIETFVPEKHAAAATACQKVSESLRSGAGERVVVHRDFYDKQVMIGAGERPGLLDFDTLGSGEASLDVANMLGHLELRVLQGACSREVAAAAAREFLDGYRPDVVVMGRVPAYLDATRIRLAMLYACWPKWAELTPVLLDSIGSPPVCETGDRLSVAKPSHRARSVHDGCEPASPLLFVVGCPRSGTTMLERMLDAHRDLAMTHETHWVTKHAKRGRDLTREGFLRPDTLDALYADHRFVRMAPPRDQIERTLRQGPLKYRRFVRLVFDHFRRSRGKRFVGDKSTGGYLRDIDRLLEVCPNSRIVHLVRDGRDVCLSMLNWPKNARAAGRFPMFADDPVATTAAWWQWHVRAGIEQGRSLSGGAYRELRYEELVQEPDRQCAMLCEFLGLEYDPAMARFHDGRSSPSTGKSANAAWLAPTPGLRDWRTQMSDEQIAMFEAIAGDTLAMLGYERWFPRVAPQVARLASERVARWEQEVGLGAQAPSDSDVILTPGIQMTQGEIR